MNKLEQRNFVESLGKAVIKDVISSIVKGKTPEEWDGIELRQFMVDSFIRCTFPDYLEGKRKREYNKTKIINNL